MFMFGIENDELEKNSKKWNFDEIKEIISLAENRYFDVADPVKGNDYICFLNETFIKAVLSIKEIFSLIYNGFQNGSMTLSKELYESMVLLSFIEQNKEDEQITERYFDDCNLKLISESINLLKFLHSGADDKNIKKGMVEMIDHKKQMYQNLKKKYAKMLPDGIFRPYWWAGADNDGKNMSFNSIHKSTRWYNTIFRHIYETASHKSYTASATDTQTARDMSAPSLESFELPVCFALTSFGGICQTVFFNFEIEYKDINDQIETIVKPMLSEIWQ